MNLSEQRLGEAAVFLLPSLKLKQRSADGAPVEEKIHRFLMDNFGGYTAAAGNIFGYWVDDEGRHSYGEHRQFLVAIQGEEKRAKLQQFLAAIGRELGEDSILLQIGSSVSLIWSAPKDS